MSEKKRKAGAKAMDWRVLLATFGTIFLAEMGDKTQLAAMTMAAQTKRPWTVFAGASLALICVSAPHDINAYLNLLRREGALALVGAPEKPLEVGAFSLITNGRSLAGSMIGGIRETQEMLDYCAEHGISSDIELIPIRRIEEAYERTVKGDVRYRFVIDTASLASER